ncbi:MAG: sialate O-acetylesterase [Acidobacteriia bacterium]|nr:sialate O-acetylesterase [Terriglobia bacterium]
MAFFAAMAGRAEVTLPAVLGDHMVMQRRQPIHVWGRAGIREAVAVSFRGETRATAADGLGFWSVYLPASEAGGPFELSVKGNNAITLRDVMVGEVWVDSGQSNMEFALRGALNGEAEVAAANHPNIRFFKVNRKTSPFPATDAAAIPWQSCTPQNAGGYSAIAYFFARDLEQKLQVPIGVIDSYWGGTFIEAWMSLRALSSSADFMPAFALWGRTIENYDALQARREQRTVAWKESVAKAKAEGRTPPGLPWEQNQDNVDMPTGLYNAMIAPLTPYPISGVIWYQGESNASPERVPMYAAMFETMIRDWRRAWGIGDFPFLFVQLANFRSGPNSRWPELREAQTQTLGVANTAMAVTIDIGEPGNIHPRNKQEVGRRLALAARAVAYGEKLEYSGPLFRAAVPEGETVRVFFDHAGGLAAKDGPALKGFLVAGADRRFAAAEARIDGSTVVVSSASVAQPLYVRYGWADAPECNLYNADGLPASPFRSGP